MRLTIAVLLVTALCSAAEVNTSRSKQNTEDVRTDKRALVEGNAGVEKRAPGISTATPSVTPGIEYADSKGEQPEKHNTAQQQIYATPAPQIAKFSDVLTGQGPPFQTAIASHLYSPVSIYQPRLGTPTIYEVSAPVPSQLAYAEHKVSYQPQQNAIQYAQQEYRQPLPNPKEAIARLTINYQPNHVPYYQQQVSVQPQPVVYTQQQTPQQIYHQIPQAYQPQVAYTHNQAQQLQPVQVYSQNQVQQAKEQQSPVQLEQQVQPQVVYAQKEVTEEHQRPAERELKTAQTERIEPAVKQTQVQQIQQNYNAQPQGEINYASFSHNPQTPQIQTQQYQVQVSHVPAQQYQVQPQQYQHLQYQQAQQYQVQPNYQAVQYQPQPQYVVAKPELTPANVVGAAKVVSTNPSRQVAYFRQGPSLQLFQQQPQVMPLNREVQHQYVAQHLAAAPTFPPVQYFGKFAQSIFGGRQH